MKIKHLILAMIILLNGALARAEEMKWPTLQNLKSVEADNIYERPYSLWDSHVNMQAIYRNTGVMVGGSLVAMGVLYLMPQSFTNWDDEDRKEPWKKWWHKVSRGPVWDEDDFFLNYVTHPYFGAVYYMGARSAGAGAGYAFLYSALLSTFFWEYGVEAFAERPSIQDLIVTPVCGSILGEGFYLAKRHIKEHNDELWGSVALGKAAMFIMDPITEVTDWIFADKPAEKQSLSLSSQPIVTTHGGVGYGLHLTLQF